MTDNYPLQVHRLASNDVIEENEAGMFSIITQVKAQAVKMVDELVVSEAIKVAYQEGISHLYLLDRDFVIRALTNEIERWKKENE